MAKLSTYLIGMIVASFVIVGFMGVISSLYVNYSPDSYNSTRMESYNKLVELSQQTEAYKNTTSELKTKQGALDILGDLFTGGYQVIKQVTGSYTTLITMTSSASEDLQLGYLGNSFRIMIGAIIIIVLFVGIMLSSIVKREM